MSVDKNLVIQKSNLEGMKWFDPLKENVKFYGFNWIKENNDYTRLPKRYLDEVKKVTQKVAALSKNSSGGQLHFVSNTKKLVIHAKVLNCAHLSGMTYVGQAGFDCYVGTSYSDLKFYDTARFEVSKEEYEFTLFQNQPGNEKLIVINFPLYSNVEALEFAIDEDSYIATPNENLNANGKIVYYGTSITQGGCASRPGLAYTNIITRKLNCELINLGFSGNAFGEEIIAKIISEITDASLFVIDYEANGGTNGKLELTLEKFIKTIRRLNPTKPIAIISRIKYLFDDLNPTLGEKREKIRLFQENLVKRMNEKGDNHIYYINGSKLLGDDYHEFTIDSIHPNDLGFMMMANNLVKEFQKIKDLEGENNE